MRQEKFDEINLKDVKKLTKEQLIKIGAKVKQMRIERGLTQNDLAFYSFSNLSSYLRLEKGKLSNVTLLTLMKLSEFYGIPVIEFFM